MALIEFVVGKTGETNIDKLVELVCDELMDRYQNDALEYHLAQMHLNTTSEVRRTIRCYMISKKFFPEKTYIRKIKLSPIPMPVGA